MPKIGECPSCGYTTELKLSRSGPPASKTAYLCEVCRSTLIGNAYFWPVQYENVEVLRSMGWIANRLLEEIRKAKSVMGKIPK